MISHNHLAVNSVRNESVDPNSAPAIKEKAGDSLAENTPVKPKRPKRSAGSALAKLLEDSMWYIESSGGSRVRESSLKIEKLKEEQIASMIQEHKEERGLTADEVAEQERKKQLRREKSRMRAQETKRKQLEKKLERQKQAAERKRLAEEGKLDAKPKAKRSKFADMDISADDLEPSKYYGGGEFAQLLKASIFFTNQGGKTFDGTRREVKPVERLTDDEEYVKSLRRASKGKKLKQPSHNNTPSSSSHKPAKKEKSISPKEDSIESEEFKVSKKDTTTLDENVELKKESNQQKEKVPTDRESSAETEPIWFTNVSNDDTVEISPEWKFFEDFIYGNVNDTFIPTDIVHAADIIRSKIKIYRTDHEVYKLQRVNLHFPFSEYRENYLLALPKDDVQFNPFEEIGKFMELMTILFFPEEEKVKVMNFEEPADCIIGRYINSFENNDIENLIKSINEFNDLIDGLRHNGKLLEYTKNRTTFPRVAVYELLNQCYSRRVLPDSKKLSNYKAFSNEVYGELMPAFLTVVYEKCQLDFKSCFIDLGSGVGNCVIQAALEFGSESHGVEIAKNASRLGDLQLAEFESRCRIFGLKPGLASLFSQQSFVDNPAVKEIIDRCNVILVNNYLFDNNLNKKVIELIQDLKVGTKIISLKPIVPATHKINWDNCSSILNRLKTSKFIYQENSVSWTSKGGFYYITEVMDDILEDNFVVFKSRESRKRDEGLDDRSRSDTPLNAFTNNV